jgi:hypothetical protein
LKATGRGKRDQRLAAAAQAYVSSLFFGDAQPATGGGTGGAALATGTTRASGSESGGPTGTSASGSGKDEATEGLCAGTVGSSGESKPHHDDLNNTPVLILKLVFHPSLPDYFSNTTYQVLPAVPVTLQSQIPQVMQAQVHRQG